LHTTAQDENLSLKKCFLRYIIHRTLLKNFSNTDNTLAVGTVLIHLKFNTAHCSFAHTDYNFFFPHAAITLTMAKLG